MILDGKLEVMKMPLGNKHECIYECNRNVKCDCSDCSTCRYNPTASKKKQYYASGMTLIEGKWLSCGWTIEADSFVEAAQIAEADEKFRLHSLSDNVMY